MADKKWTDKDTKDFKDFGIQIITIGHLDANQAKRLSELIGNACERIQKLKEILTEYGRHQGGCSAQYNTSHSKYRCRCGWDREKKQALKGGK